MAVPTQFTFDVVEATVALIKHQGIHDGEWTLGVEFNVAVGQMGPTPEQARPGVMLMAQNLLLVAANPGSPPNMIVDATKVNPREG